MLALRLRLVHARKSCVTTSPIQPVAPVWSRPSVFTSLDPVTRSKIWHSRPAMTGSMEGARSLTFLAMVSRITFMIRHGYCSAKCPRARRCACRAEYTNAAWRLPSHRAPETQDGIRQAATSLNSEASDTGCFDTTATGSLACGDALRCVCVRVAQTNTPQHVIPAPLDNHPLNPYSLEQTGWETFFKKPHITLLSPRVSLL